MPEIKGKEKYVIKIPLVGWLMGENKGGSVKLYMPGGITICDDPFSAHIFTSEQSAKEIAVLLCKSTLTKDSFVLTYEEAVALYSNEKAAARSDPEAEKEAEAAAKSGLGYTEEEWGQMPDSYSANCFKQCYTVTTMEKGDVWEFGIRGVYRCRACSYAYAPLFWPDPSGPGSAKRAAKMNKISEGPNKRKSEWDAAHKIKLQTSDDTAFPTAFPPPADIDDLRQAIDQVRIIVSGQVDSPVLEIEVREWNDALPSLNLAISGTIKKGVSDRKLFSNLQEILSTSNGRLKRRAFGSIENRMSDGWATTILPGPK